MTPDLAAARVADSSTGNGAGSGSSTRAAGPTPEQFVVTVNRFFRSATAHLTEPKAVSRALSILDEHAPMRVSAFAIEDRSSQPAATELLQRLEADGLVHRRADPADGRAVVVELSDAGRARLAAIRASIAERLAPRFDELSEQDRAALSRTLELVRAWMHPETANPETADPETADPGSADPETADPEAADPEPSTPERRSR